MKSGAQEVGVTQRGEENKGGEGGKNSMPRMLVEDKDDAGNDKSGLL